MLSSDAARAKASAPDYDIADRAYGSFKEMVAAEKKRPDRVDFVSVATPNHTHFEIAKAAPRPASTSICDKPMTFDLAQAEELAEGRRQVAASCSPSRTTTPATRSCGRPAR